MKPIKEILHNNIYNDLSYYICEAKFDQYIKIDSNNIESKFEELINVCNKINSKLEKYSVIENVKTLLNTIFKDSNNETEKLFIYSLESSYFKIPYSYSKNIIDAIDAIDQDNNIFNYQQKGIKVIVRANGIPGKIFETGTGSIGRISTSQQETAICMVWNEYVKHPVKYMDDINNIKTIIKDMCCEFDESWIKAFQQQVFAIKNYLGGNYKNYRMFRYGDNNIEDINVKEVSDMYKKFISTYTKAVSQSNDSIGSRKDNYDPSDVIIYEIQKTDVIKNILGKCISLINGQNSDLLNAKEKFTKNLFIKKYLRGISLKKIGSNSSNYKVFNIGENVIGGVTDFKVKKSNESLVIVCKGSFNFSNLTDASGDEVGKPDSVILTMRSFGGDSTGVDCKLDEDAAALGKCSVDVWRPIIGADKRKTTEECIKLFKKYINDDDSKSDVLSDLTKIIKSAVKEGALCFPFILIH